MSLLQLVTTVVEESDPAIASFVDVLGFELIENSQALTNDGRAKRCVVVRKRRSSGGRRADGRVSSTWPATAGTC